MVLGEFKDGAVGQLWRQTSDAHALSDFGEASFSRVLTLPTVSSVHGPTFYVRRRLSYVHDEVDLTNRDEASMSWSHGVIYS